MVETTRRVNPIEHLTQSQRKANVPAFGPGDQVQVWCRIMEQDRVRLSPFEGIVIRRRGSGLSETFTVRRLTYGEGVERIFPVHAPVLERIDVIRRGKVRRARLYYLRRKVGKTRLPAAPQSAGGAQAGLASAQTGGVDQPASQSEGREADEPRPAEEPQPT